MSMLAAPGLGTFVSANLFHRRSSGLGGESLIPFGDTYVQIASINGGFAPSGLDKVVPNTDIGDVDHATQEVGLRVERYSGRSRFKMWLTSDGEPATWTFDTGGSTSGIPAFIFLSMVSGTETVTYEVDADLSVVCPPPCGTPLVSTLDVNEPNPEGYVP
jgi:hypothetical protein